METNKDQLIIIGLLIFIVGLILGYFFGNGGMMGNRGFYFNESMHEEMEEHMYGDEIIDGDGAMIHAMDEMMLGFRGRTGEEYEEVFLKSMIVHHFGAVRIAEDLLENTDRPELRVFAQDIIDTQSAEIEKMKNWLDIWFNSEN